MIKIQLLKDSAVITKNILIPFSALFLVISSLSVSAEPIESIANGKLTHSQIIMHRLKDGESASEVLSRLGSRGAHKVVSSNQDRTHLTILTTDSPREFKGFNSGETTSRSYFGRRFTNRYTQKFNMMQLASAQGLIDTTLSNAGRKAGLSEELLDQLTQIFAWDIDFATNLHPGDRFTVVYERGGFNGADDIVAAEFVNRGKTYKAVRYIDKEGFANYFTPDGKALQKAFLSTPVDFARISSGFNLSRHHPVLNRIRAHKGVDYAARTGTPVKATGNGQVSFLGRKGGFGQVVMIQHGDRYETVYAHLSKFRPGLSEGTTVRQGDVIGYVGQTGLATGPHLHYEFRVDGVHQNPLIAQATTNAIPVKQTELAEFRSQVQSPLSKLDLVKANSLFAKNNNQYN